MGLFSKKNKGAEADDSNRSALFGSRKGKESPAAQNPYAAPPANDPYAQPPPSYSSPGQDTSFRQDKTPAVTGPGQSYGQRPGGYGAQGGSYGAQSGYGNDRYGGGAPQRPGGYGGLGRTTSDDTMTTEAGRNELFGNAAQRQQAQPQQQSGGYGQSGAYGDSQGGYGGGAPGGYGSTPGGYGTYEDRQLTAEEQEEEDINATKQEIKFIKQQDVSSTRNALRLAEQAMETGRGTLSTMAAQGERIHNTERNLDLAAIQSDRANGQTKELARINASMFSIVPNPFTGNSKREKEMQRAMDQHARDRDTREQTNRAAWESRARADQAQRGLKTAGAGIGGNKASLAQRSKYQMEPDSDDDAAEDEIENNLDQLHIAAKSLNHLGRAMGEEADKQNQHIATITGKTDSVDDKIARNRLKLDRIR
ncbi:protein transport protein sec9 [Stemphylium lycopersici]|uniref:Protein transport protein sec9 n=1 Tax=Stemphylium lycopersici TaxID=183478 RepID=A0A364NEU0_STELY|nr:protein transport protein sec9 [Stemphylium lycopersici]RAR06546.1 protein transport protein sec9 [Stemphylium lycopersici]RAR15828.1 protein transport protein sec9 [Stemphylium lycopersici]